MTIVEGRPAYLVPGSAAGVMLLHEWWGLVPQIKSVCDRLAVAGGFSVVAPDLYGGSTAPYDQPDRARALMNNMDRDWAIQHAAHAVEALRERGCPRVGVTGFCLGGAVSLAASAVCPVDATVSYYGVWPEYGERSITTPILAHVAEHEEHNPPAGPEQFPRWFEGMTNAEIHVYPGTRHAFANDARPEAYSERDASTAWLVPLASWHGTCCLSMLTATSEPLTGQIVPA